MFQHFTSSEQKETSAIYYEYSLLFGIRGEIYINIQFNSYQNSSCYLNWYIMNIAYCHTNHTIFIVVFIIVCKWHKPENLQTLTYDCWNQNWGVIVKYVTPYHCKVIYKPIPGKITISIIGYIQSSLNAVGIN